MLQWANANGCHLNPAECKNAADNGLQGFMEIHGMAPIHIPKISEATHKAITEWIAVWIAANSRPTAAKQQPVSSPMRGAHAVPRLRGKQEPAPPLSRPGSGEQPVRGQPDTNATNSASLIRPFLESFGQPYRAPR